MGMQVAPTLEVIGLALVGSGGVFSVVLYFLDKPRKRLQDKLEQDKLTLEHEKLTLEHEKAEASEKIQTRTADQQTMKLMQDQISGNMKRLETLEGYREKDSRRIEELHTNKIELEGKVGLLQNEVAILTNRIEAYKEHEAVYKTQITELELRLTAKNEELRCALSDLEKATRIHA